MAAANAANAAIRGPMELQVEEACTRLFDGRSRISRAEFMSAAARGQVPMPSRPSGSRWEAPRLPPVVDGGELHSLFDVSMEGNVSRQEYVDGMGYLHVGGPVGAPVFPWARCEQEGGTSGGPSFGAAPPGAVKALRASGFSQAAAAQTACAASERASASRREKESHGKPETLTVKLPQPRVRGGTRFINGVPENQLAMANADICATGSPDMDYSLLPDPNVKCKSWYNTYLYLPDHALGTKKGGQFMERYVQGPDGEWLDFDKAQKLAEHIADQRRQAVQAMKTREALLHGAAWSRTIDENEEGIGVSGGAGKTAYRDAYCGQQLVEFNGLLLPQSEHMARNNVHQSEWSSMVNVPEMFDWDNFRVPWPFGRNRRSKQISQNVYDWFDRNGQNEFIESDRSYKIMELPSMFVDENNYERWRARGNDPFQLTADLATRCRYFDDYPYSL